MNQMGLNISKSLPFKSLFTSSTYFEIWPFIISLQARPESTTIFLFCFCFLFFSLKYPRNFLLISGTFWPSLGHLGRQHHALASVWPSKRHFLEERRRYTLMQNSITVLLCMHMFRNFEPPFCFQLLSPLGFLGFRPCKINCFLITKNDIWIHKSRKFLLKVSTVSWFRQAAKLPSRKLLTAGAPSSRRKRNRKLKT